MSAYSHKRTFRNNPSNVRFRGVSGRTCVLEEKKPLQFRTFSASQVFKIIGVAGFTVNSWSRLGVKNGLERLASCHSKLEPSVALQPSKEYPLPPSVDSSGEWGVFGKSSAKTVAKKTPKPFWETKTLGQMNKQEWEALCDGCAKCCLNKLENETTGEIQYTDVACRLLDTEKCRCVSYDDRKRYVPDCQILNPKNVKCRGVGRVHPGRVPGQPGFDLATRGPRRTRARGCHCAPRTSNGG